MCSKMHQISWENRMVTCSRQTAHQLNTDIRNLVMVLTKMGKNKYTCHMFDNEFLSSSKKFKLCPRDFIFPIKQEDVCDYNTQCFMSSGLMLDDIIINLFSDITKQTTDSVKKDLFFKFKEYTIYLYKGYLQDYS